MSFSEEETFLFFAFSTRRESKLVACARIIRSSEMNSFRREPIVARDVDFPHVGLFSFATENSSLPALRASAGGNLYGGQLTWDVALQSGFLGFVCLAAVFSNFLVAYTLIRKEQLLVPSNRLVFNLTASNFVFSVFILPFVVVSTAQQKWMFGIFWCNFSGFFTLLVGIASILTSAMIAVDRYYAIVKPMVYTRTITVAKSTAMLLWVWIQATVCSLPPLFGWSRFDCLKTKATCSVVWRDDVFYTSFLLALCVFLPLSVMASCYYFIFQVVRSKCRKINVGTVTATGEIAAVNQCKPPNTQLLAVPMPSRCQPMVHRLSIPSRKPSLVLLSTHSSLSKGFRTICIVLGMFLVTWVPSVAIAIAEIASDPSCLADVFRVLALCLLYSSSVGYPIVYGVYNRSIRKEIRTCLCPPSSKVMKGLPRRNSRRLSFSGGGGGLFEYAPFRGRTPMSARTSFDYGRASIDLGSLPTFRKDTTPRRPSQDSGAIMTESDVDTDFSFLPSYWFGRRGSVSSRSGFHQLSAKLGFLRRRPSSPTVGGTSRQFPILQIVDDASTNVHAEITEHQQREDQVDCRNQVSLPDVSTLSGTVSGSPSQQRLADDGQRVLNLGAGDTDEILFTRKRSLLQVRGASIDEGIVNDCIIQDVESN